MIERDRLIDAFDHVLANMLLAGVSGDGEAMNKIKALREIESAIVLSYNERISDE